MFTHMSWTRGGLAIRGAEYRPEGFDEKKRYKAVVISHGFTGNYMDNDWFARKFAGLGYVVYLFSFCGGSADDAPADLKSDGSSLDMSVLSETGDLLCVLDDICGRSYIDEESVTLAGFSQGGFVSGLAAAKRPRNVENLIMVYPALCIPDHARVGRLGGAFYPVNDVPEIIDCGRIKLGKAFHDEMAAFDPYKELAKYPGEVLILHGFDDPVVDYSYSVRAKRNYRPGQCSLQLIRGLSHGQNETQAESMFASMRCFLEGKREVLTVRVLITHIDEEKTAESAMKKIYFTGFCESESFTGTIMSEGCDVNETEPGKSVKIRAEYTITGLDRDGNRAELHVVNSNRGDEFKPVITTENESLRWLEEAELTAVLEHAKGGPTVRIYSDMWPVSG